MKIQLLAVAFCLWAYGAQWSTARGGEQSKRWASQSFVESRGKFSKLELEMPRFADWRQESFLPTSNPIRTNELRIPVLGDHLRIQRELAKDRSLLPGVNYKPAGGPQDTPLTSYVDELRGIKQRLGPAAAYLYWLNRVRPEGVWDLKNQITTRDRHLFYLYRLEYENAGNFLFGLTGQEVGNSPGFLDLGAGLVNQLQAAYRGKWAPYGGLFSPTIGDDPVDWVYSSMGQEYYSTGQYLLDYFDDPSRLPPGDARNEALLREAMRSDIWDEARRRLGDMELNAKARAEVEERMKNEDERRDARYQEQYDRQPTAPATPPNAPPVRETFPPVKEVVPYDPGLDSPIVVPGRT